MQIVKWVLILLLITAVGTFLRISNISPYKFYPDAYQNLLVAENIKTYQSVVGYMGEGGMFFPPFFMWSRPLYAILINITDIFTNDPARAAQIVSLIAGILAIPISFLFLKSIFSSKLVGLCASLLLALSFNHAVWGGFIFTETTAILFLTICLWLLFANLRVIPKLANVSDLGSGFFLGLSLFARYEYAILILSLILLIFAVSINPFVKLINFLTALLLVTSVFLSILFPVTSMYRVIFDQLQRLLIAGLFIFVLFIGVIAGNLLVSKDQKQRLLQLASCLSIAGILLLTAYIFLPISNLVGLRNFAGNDFVLAILTIFGIISMLLTPKYRILAFFVIFASVSLGFIYFKVNPQMQRYGTHLVPFLLIPASLALSKIVRIIFNALEKRELKISAVVLVIILISSLGFQVFQTFRGMRNWDNGDWYRPSYEEKAAKVVADRIGNKKVLLVTSFPEAYYYFSKQTTHSINNQAPFIYINDSLNETDTFIVLDMGMHDIFPNFTDFVVNNLQPYKVVEFRINETYHYLAYSKDEEFPVEIYEIKLADLKARIMEAAN